MSGRIRLLVCITMLSATGATEAASVDLALRGTGLSLGESERIRGLRIDLLDRNLRHVQGINVTLLVSRQPRDGDVSGVAIGLSPGLRRLHGVGVGAMGIAARELSGVALGLLGTGIGGDADGLLVGGLGTSVTGSLRGITVAGVGTHVEGDYRAVGLAGIGMRVAGDARGLLIGGIGAAVGGDMTGVAAGLGGVDVGGALHGVALGGLTVSAPRVVGATLALFNGAVPDGFRLRGVNETHTGLALGLINYSGSLHGVQIGLLNYVGNNPKWARLLPLFNVHM